MKKIPESKDTEADDDEDCSYDEIKKGKTSELAQKALKRLKKAKKE